MINQTQKGCRELWMLRNFMIKKEQMFAMKKQQTLLVYSFLFLISGLKNSSLNVLSSPFCFLKYLEGTIFSAAENWRCKLCRCKLCN